MRGRRFINLFGGVRPAWVQPIAAVDADLANSRYFGGSLASLFSVTRAAIVTNLTPASAAGASFLTYGANVPAIDPGSGLNIFSSKNNLLNCLAPATQITASMAAGTYTLWVNGSGSAVSSAGTAVGTGFGTATNGSVNTFTLSAPGTVVVTVSGSLNAFQLEPLAFGTPLIPTTAAAVTRTDAVTAAGALLNALKGATGSVVLTTSALGHAAVAGTRIMMGSSYPVLINGDSQLQVQSTSTALFPLAGSGLFSTSAMKSGVAWDVSGDMAVLSGGTPATGTGTFGGQTSFSIGSNNGTSQFYNGSFPRITAYTTKLAYPQ